MIVIPTINVTELETARRQIEKAAEFFPPVGGWIQIDVADGVFVENVTWGNPEELQKIIDQNPKLKTLNFEIHLMVNNPEAVMDDWIKILSVKRIIIHLEVMDNPFYILKRCKKYGVEAGLTINPQTEPERLLAHLDNFHYFQILSVNPGRAGQNFQLETLDKIKFLREIAPDAKIEVDGGINLEIGKLCKEAGADILASASYIFSAPDPQKVYEDLKNI